MLCKFVRRMSSPLDEGRLATSRLIRFRVRVFIETVYIYSSNTINSEADGLATSYILVAVVAVTLLKLNSCQKAFIVFTIKIAHKIICLK